MADSVTHREKFYGIQGYEKPTKSFFFLLRIFKPCYTRPALILLQKVKIRGEWLITFSGQVIPKGKGEPGFANTF